MQPGTPRHFRHFVRTLSLASLVFGMAPAADAGPQAAAEAPSGPGKSGEIKAYCLDFNWAPTGRRGRPFANPGLWKDADPAAHVAWYKSIGANVIQTFCVSTNGYAWYKNGVVPEQPGLKHDFLPELVKLGHKEGMKVMGYFCIASNPRWGAEHPDLSYGTPTTYHLPYTDPYLAYLSEAIGDAVRRTGIDGFMVDWLWMPKRLSTEGKWLPCEKDLYQQLMGEPFPGEDKLSKAQDTEYSRKSIDRCWKVIRKAAKDANPDCIVWLTVNQINHPHVLNSDMYQETDWLMNEAGSLEAINKIKHMAGGHTRLLTCMAVWNGQDASTAVPEAIEAGVGLYGFTAPRNGSGLVPLDKILTRQVSSLSGDDRNIAVLARAYQGKSIHALWQDGTFVEPDNPPPFRVSLNGRGRGSQDTALISHGQDGTAVTVTSPYGKGRGQLVRAVGKEWPASLTIRLQKQPDVTTSATAIRMANGTHGLIVPLDGAPTALIGKEEAGLAMGSLFGEKFLDGDRSESEVGVNKSEKVIEIEVPPEMIEGNPEILVFQWDNA